MSDVIAQTKAFFEGDPDLRLALLFGSFASGRHHAGSDLDVAVAYPRRMTVDEKIHKAQALSALIKREVDLVDLREASGLLLQQILAGRKTLVNRDAELYGNIMARRLSEESDFMPLYDLMLRARRERFLNGKKGT